MKYKFREPQYRELQHVLTIKDKIVSEDNVIRLSGVLEGQKFILSFGPNNCDTNNNLKSGRTCYSYGLFSYNTIIVHFRVSKVNFNRQSIQIQAFEQ